MTLKDLFDLLSENPVWILAYFILLPLTAAIAGFMGKGEGHLSPWKYLYSTLIYLVCIPGIISVSFNLYLFLFENQSIYDTYIYTQILPIASMVITLLLIRNNVSLEHIPGFDKLSGLFTLIFAVLFLMWILDRTRIFVVAFTHMPFYYVGLIFIGLLLMIRFGINKMLKSSR